MRGEEPEYCRMLQPPLRGRIAARPDGCLRCSRSPSGVSTLAPRTEGGTVSVKAQKYHDHSTAYRFQPREPDVDLESPVSDRFSLDGRVAIVTGASSGLGVAIALGMSQCGARVALAARRADRLRGTADLISAHGGTALTVPTDVTQANECGQLVESAMSRFGRVDILVNNAGAGGDFIPSIDDPPENFLNTVNVNLNGAYWMAQASARVMTPGSSIVNISSVIAQTTFKMPAAGYAAAKSGLLGLTRDLAAQWGSRGIRVNAILPGVFPSEGTAHYSENYQRKVIETRIPIGRIGDPSDIAAAAVFLGSAASSYITGVSLPVDGGVLLFLGPWPGEP